MAFKIELAAVLRVIREQRGLSYSDINDATFRTTVSLIERGKTGISFSKLAELAAALDFDLTALVALCVSLERGEPAHATLASAYQELERFLGAGGSERLQAQLDGASLAQRPIGKPAKLENIRAVRELKAQGLTQAEVVRRLGISQSSVQRYWHLKHSSDASSE